LEGSCFLLLGGLQQYVIRMWMTDEGGGLAAVLYGASKVRAKVGAHSHEVEIVQETSWLAGLVFAGLSDIFCEPRMA